MSTLPHQSVNPTPRLFWKGASGATYEFEHFALQNVTFNPKAGVYIFCKQGTDGLWYSVYVGETDNFRRRLADELSSHHRINDITRAGATHICALVVPGDVAARLAIETDLRHSLNPPCNRQ
jgi:hypothetical protein